jgi:hypothetical protein
MREEPEARDHLYRNVAGDLVDVTPSLLLERGGSHGVQWADFDADGDLDLSLANNNPEASHPLYRNLLPRRQAGRSIQVAVLDTDGIASLPGAEVRIYAAGTDRLLGTRLVDTGGGYCSQNVMPVHVGLGPGVELVDVVVTTLGSDGRSNTLVPNVKPKDVPNRVLVVRAGH